MLGILTVLVLAIPAAAPAAPGEMGCDPLDPAVCLQPFPNDYFTVDDPTTDTGRRLNLNLAGDAAQQRRHPIDPTE